MKRLSCLVLSLSILSSLVFFASPVLAQFSIAVPTIPPINAGDTKDFTLTIQNSGSEEWFTISVLGTRQDWMSLETSAIKVPANSSASVKGSVTPASDAFSATYSFNLIVAGVTGGQKIEKEVLVPVVQKTSAIIKNFALSCNEAAKQVNCKPSETVTISGDVINIGTTVLDSLKLNLLIKTPTAEIKKTLSMGTLDLHATKGFVTDFSLGKYQEPGDYFVTAQLTAVEETFDTKSASFSVPFTPSMLYDKKVSSSIFGTFVTLAAVNDGNAKDTAKLKSAVSKEWFVSYSGPQPQQKNGEYVWSAELQPTEKMEIKYSEIYWPTFAFILIVIGAGVFFYLQVSAVSIKKKVLQRYAAAEGKEFAISIDVKNRGKAVENVVVKDTVPPIFAVTEKYETIRPALRKTDEGLELTWRVGRLKPKEERVLHYKMKSLVGIIGSAKLPKAKLRYKIGESHRERDSSSVLVFGIKEK